MQAKITGIQKRRVGGDLMIVTNVDFIDAAGKTVHSQEYGHLPADVDPEYFQRQADTMQADLEQAAQAKREAEIGAPDEAAADDAIVRMRHVLQFEDGVKIHDRKN